MNRKYSLRYEIAIKIRIFSLVLWTRFSVVHQSCSNRFWYNLTRSGSTACSIWHSSTVYMSQYLLVQWYACGATYSSLVTKVACLALLNSSSVVQQSCPLVQAWPRFCVMRLHGTFPPFAVNSKSWSYMISFLIPWFVTEKASSFDCVACNIHWACVARGFAIFASAKLFWMI